MRKLLPILLIFILGFFGCKKDSDDTTNPNIDANAALLDAITLASDGEGTSRFEMPDGDVLSSIPQDPKNPLTSSKVALGKLLYHETALSIATMKPLGEGKTSCSSCHFASAGFQAGRFQGIGEGGVGFGINGEGRERGMLYAEEDLDVQPVRTPSAMNGAYQINQLWNGQFGATGLNTGTSYAWAEGTPIATNELGYEGLEIQAIAGLAVHRMDIDMDLLEPFGYKEKFDIAFPDFEEADRYTKETAGLAIAAYERTLLANQSPFQLWLKGNKSAMTEQEIMGAAIFFDKGKCVSCHDGPALNKMEFHAIGMNELNDCPEETFKTSTPGNEHLGRGGFTGLEEDNFKFKTPQLYNLSDSPFYGHGSSFRTIREVIEYKNNAVAQNQEVPQSALSSEFIPLGLTNQEIDDLVVFLTTGLRDPNLTRYEPEAVLSGNCYPFADPMAASDLGCD